MKKLVFLIIALTATLHATTVKDKLASAEGGSYVVFEQGGLINLILLREKNADGYLFEEVSVSKKNAPKKGAFKEWAASYAPNHLSWTAFVMQPSGRITKVYSFSHKRWENAQSVDAVFGKLFNLHLTPVPQENRRKIGPPPAPGEPDLRSQWCPPLTIEGKQTRSHNITVQTALWPHDQSPLSGQEIQLYFDDDRPEFVFPVWIQVNDPRISYKLKAFDSGSGMSSPMSRLSMSHPITIHE